MATIAEQDIQTLKTMLSKAQDHLKFVEDAKVDKFAAPRVIYVIRNDSGKDVGEYFYKRYNIGFDNRVTDSLSGIRFLYSDLTKLKEKLQKYSSDLRLDIHNKNEAILKDRKKSGLNPDGTVKVPKKNDYITYNVGSVAYSYYQNSAKKFTEMAGFSKDGNSPRIVADALELWKQSTNHKGMITTWNKIDSVMAIPGTGLSGATQDVVYDTNRYAFQFLYNPMTVTMQYNGAPAIDVTMFTSGREQFAPWTGTGGGGTISFDIIINRMPDMELYNPDATLKVKNAYVNRQPYGKNDAKSASMFNEQEAIYNTGTMYDIEFLLRTVLGFTLKTEFRGVTADVGWIGAYPIELHLGKGLRYWAIITGLTIQHGIFDERMVPVFSTVNITASRLPDYASYTGNQYTDAAGNRDSSKNPDVRNQLRN